MNDKLADMILKSGRLYNLESLALAKDIAGPRKRWFRVEGRKEPAKV